jgi:hypothetical protein
MLVCDSRDCDNAIHLRCMVGGYTEVPAHQFHCGQCCKRFKCAKCGRDSRNHVDWISCSQCGQQAHVDCFGAQSFFSVSSDYVCADCHCHVCARVLDDDSYACVSCTEHFDEACRSSTVIGADYYCAACAAPKLAELAEALDIQQADEQQIDDDAADNGEVIDVLYSLSFASTLPDSAEPHFLIALRNLAALNRDPRRRLLLITLKDYLNGHALQPSTIRAVLEAAAESWNVERASLLLLCDALPPLNLNRVLARLCPLNLIEATRQYTIDGVTYAAELVMRKPEDLFVQLYCSSQNRQNIPVYSSSASPCASVIGSRMAALHNALDLLYPDDRERNVTRLLYSWSNDETSSSYAAANPVILWLHSMDYHGVVINMETAVAELGFLPTLAAIRCTDQSNRSVPVSQCGAKLGAALNALSLDFVRFMFQQINLMGIDGVLRFTFNGESCAIRPVLYSLVLDLQEQRRFFDAPSCTWWSCVHCYNVNRGFDFSALKHVDLTKRTGATDGVLRALISESHADPTFNDAKASKRLSGQLGLKPSKSSRSVLLRANNKPALPFAGEVAQLAGFDVLHGAQGAMKKVFDLLSEGVCSKEWLALCAELGDKTYTVPAVVSFLRFEDYMQDWFFLVIALHTLDNPLRPKFQNRVPEVTVDVVRNLAVALLFVCYSCKDEAPGDIVQEIDQACAQLAASYQTFITGVRKYKSEEDEGDDGKRTQALDTLKIHLLSRHVPEIVRAFGCLKQESTLLMESRHAQTKWDKSIGGAHVSYAPKALLLKGFWRSILADLSATPASHVRPGMPYEPMERREIHRLADRRALWTVVADNFAAIEHRVTGLCPLDQDKLRHALGELNLGDEPVWSNTLECWTECATRRTRIVSEVICQVPFTSRARASGRLTAMSFKEQPYVSAGASACRSAFCLAHNPRVELFPPLSRVRNSKLGIPLLFIKSSTHEDKQYALLLVLKDEPWERSAVIPRFTVDYVATFVPLAHVRDWHLLAHRDGFFYQCLAGSRSFGHLA